MTRSHILSTRVRKNVATPRLASKVSAPAAMTTTTIRTVWLTWLM